MWTNIVIPIYNRPEHTRQTLESLIKGTDWEKARLFLIDDKSEDETASLIQTYKKFVELSGGIIRVNQTNIGPGASRNEMVDYIISEYGNDGLIYHSDNDVFYTYGWLEKLLGIFDKAYGDGCRLLGASCHPYLRNSSRYEYGDFVVGVKDAVSGYSQLIKVKDWIKYGRFSETTRDAEKKIMGSEDWEYCQRIINDGYWVGSVTPELIIPTGKTNTYGEPATGADTFIEHDGVKVI